MSKTRKLIHILLKRGQAHSDLFISLIFSISLLWWTHPDNTLLYGQDSYQFFLNVFNPILNPLHVYNIEQGWITNISIGNSYFTLALPFLLGLILTPPIVERIILMILIFFQTFGFLRLLETFNKIRGIDNKNIIASIISSLFYLANIFTLTVTLWHLELWTLPLVVAPYWLSSILEILYFKNISKNRLLQTITISIFLSPAMSGGWSVMWILLIFIALFFLLYFLLSKKWSIKETFSRFSLLFALGFSTLLWVNIPGYIIFFILHPVSSTSVSTYNSGFLATSGYYPIYKVLAGLNLSQWPIFDVQSYGWVAGYWNVLQYTSYLIIPIFFSGIFFIKRNKVLIFFYAISTPVIIFSNGDSFPFGFINNYFYHLGGVFLILVNAYYFVGAIYLASIGVIIYNLADWTIGNLKKLFGNKKSYINKKNKNNNSVEIIRINNVKPKKIGYIVVLAVLILLISVPLYPLVTSTQYSTKDNVANMIYMPPDLSEASSYLNSNASDTSGYLLILPMSDQSAYPMEFNNSQLTDTSSLFSYLSPIPIIDVNASFYDSQLFNFLWEMNYTNLVPVLQVMHISYVLFNPYFTFFDPVFYPSQKVSNISLFLQFVYNKLSTEVGKPMKYGSVSIFKIPNIVPLAYTVKNLSFVNTKSFQNYLGFISSIRNSENLSAIEDLIWINSSEIPSSYPYIQPRSFNGFSFTTSISDVNQVDMVGNNGSISEVWNRTSDLRLNSVKLDSPSILSIKTNNIKYYEEEWNNNINQSSERRIFNLSSNNENRFILNFNINNLKLNEESWNYFGIIFTKGNYTFEISFDGNVPQSEYFYNLQAFYKGKQYAWDYIHGNNYSYYFNGNDHMSIYMQNGSFNYTMTSLTNNISYNSPKFFFNPDCYFKNQGYNFSLISKISRKTMNSKLNITMFFSKIRANLSKASVAISLPYSSVILIHRNPLENNIINSTFRYNQQGDIILHLTGKSSETKYFVVLGLKNLNQWQILSTGTSWQGIDISEFYTIFKVSQNNLVSIEIGINSTVSLLIYVSLLVPLIEIAFILVYYVSKRRTSHH